MTKSTIKKVLGRAHVSLVTLQTLVTEVEAVLNDRPLTYITPDIEDADPLTPSHLPCGRRITSLPHVSIEDEEVKDPTYGTARDVQYRARKQALVIQHFRRRWKEEYLTSLREFHRATGRNDQTIKVGDIVLVHDETPRMTWKMAVIEQLIRGNDGLVRAANIRTATGRTNRPITRLVPLEVSSSDTELLRQSPPIDMTLPAKYGDSGQNEATDQVMMTGEGPNQRRPQRLAAQKGTERVAEWISELWTPAPRRMS